MAFGTIDGRMLANKREARERVIEPYILFPTADVVTTCALAAETATMRIIADMAPYAC
jgi:hypothetical protein